MTVPPASDLLARAAALPCWSGRVTPQPLKGGITNANFLVEDGGQRFVVRIGDDIPLHGVMRFNELAASRAAHAAGLSPEVVFDAPGVLVMRFIDGRTLTPAEIRQRPPTTDTFSLPQSQEEFYFALPAATLDIVLSAMNAGHASADVGLELGYQPDQIDRAYREIGRAHV